jgi:Vacuolar sorting 38 and autophagy-related subunit 14
MRLIELSASLSSTAHLLVLVSFYLSIRLPAEITLAHRDYPLPTIFTPANSYAGREVSFPGTTPTPSFSNSPVMSRHGDLRPVPRPRPLFIESKDLEEKVPQFAKKDPIAFNFFLEAISLLAWDVAWVCRTQGFHAGTEKWEDVCNIGKNLWQLLLSQPQSPGLMRVLSSRDVQNRNKNGKENAAAGLPKSTPVPKLGSVSHSSAYSFLGSAEAQELVRGWKMSKYTMIVDPLKKTLIGEMNNAEWELLQEQEWDDGGERFDGDAAVHIRNKNLDGHNFDDARSIMTAVTRVEENAENADDSSGTGRVKGTSGWTKVRGRDK